ncbi:MAG: GAF domain-containing sensor histidine kinase [Acidobacteriota bacterium]|nr:GAF domain-containing sensor histidine kinase [Acidobacteriota bacterium]
MKFRELRDPDRLHALIDAMLLMEADSPLGTLLQQIVTTATELAGARYGALGVLSRDGGSLSEFITHGLTPQEAARIGHRPTGKGVLGETIRVKSPLRIDDLTRHETSAGFPPGHPPMRRFLGVPVVTRDGHVWGNLYITEPLDDEPFSYDDELLLVTFGRVAGSVIDQSNLRRELRELSVAEERERLARDLHDTVIQRLFGVGLNLQMALPVMVNEQAKARLNQALDELNETIHDIRTTIFEIDQDRATEDTLRQRATALTSEVGNRLGVQAHLSMVSGLSQQVNEHCAHHTIQALREILSNIVRHSEATHVDVNIEDDGDFLVLSVRDNGVGFDGVSGAGRGLRNLATRAHDLGGECVIESDVGSGTLVTWTALKKA